MNKRLLELEPAHLFGNEAVLVSLSGREEISQPFEFFLTIDSPNEKIQPKDVIGKPLAVRIDLSEGKERYMHGYISHLQAGESRTSKDKAGVPSRIYTVRLVPWLWFLSQASRCFVYLPDKDTKTLKEILDKVIERVKAYGHVESWHDAGSASILSTRKVEHCLQYRETDLNFLSRLLEKYGVYYYFKHEKNKHTLVLSDNKNYPQCLENEIDYPATSGRQAMTDHITEWTHEYEFVPGKWAHSDFNFEKPADSLLVSIPKSSLISLSNNSGYEHFDNPNDYGDKADGRTEAERRMEEQETRFDRVRGASTCRTLMAGHSFKLKSHPSVPSEAGKGYVLTSVSHSASQPGRFGGGEVSNYSNQFTCIPSDRQFRPPRVTPQPVLSSIQTAFVVGPQNEVVYTDKYGRVKVQFHWDREGKRDQNTCCWVRVSQAHAGSGFGAIDLPRIGEEVIVSFLEGDPDRPIITGRLYNANALPAFGLPDHKTRTGIRTQTHLGDGYNEVVFDDKKENEQLFVHAQKNMDTVVLNDATTRIYGNQDHVVGWEKDGSKGGDKKELIYQDSHLNVKKDQIEHIEGNVRMTVGDGGAADGGDLDLKIAKNKKEQVGGDSHRIVNGKHSEKIQGDFSATIHGDHSTKVAGSLAQQSTKEIHIKSDMKLIIEAGMQLSLIGPGGFVDIGPAGITIQGTLVNINSGGAKGAGSGCNPTAPEAPQKAVPSQPKVAKKSK